MCVGCHGGRGEVGGAAAALQQGVVVEQTLQVHACDAWIHVLAHVCVEGLGFGLQGVEKAQGLATGLNLLSGQAEREDSKTQNLIRRQESDGKYVKDENLYICQSLSLSVCLYQSVFQPVSL